MGNAKYAATRMTVSIGVAVLVVMATVVPAPTVSPAVQLSASTRRVRDRRNVRLDHGLPASRRPTTPTSSRQEPVHRADPSGPDDRVRRGDDA